MSFILFLLYSTVLNLLPNNLLQKRIFIYYREAHEPQVGNEFERKFALVSYGEKQTTTKKQQKEEVIVSHEIEEETTKEQNKTKKTKCVK